MAQLQKVEPPFTEVAIAVVLSGPWVLVGLRRAGKPLAGYWEFPGGKLDQDESPVDAAARECQEETGLHLASLQSWETVEFDCPSGRLRLHFFQGALMRPQADSGLPTPRGLFRWVKIADLPYYRFPPANDRILKHLAAGIFPGKTV